MSTKKFKNRYRIVVEGKVPDLLFFAPNSEAAKFFAEACGFDVVSISLEPDQEGNKNYNLAFKEFVSIGVSREIRHEDVSAWYAPSECHGDVERQYENNLKDWEEKFNITEEELLKHFGNSMISRTINKLHSLQCPFCG